jgi:hypothetical protein
MNEGYLNEKDTTSVHFFLRQDHKHHAVKKLEKSVIGATEYSLSVR